MVNETRPVKVVFLSVFAFRAVVEDGEVRLVPADSYLTVFDGFDDCTAGFVGVRAVAETAVPAHPEDVREIMTHFLFLEINCPETLDTRRVDNPTFAFDRLCPVLTFD